MEQLFCERIAGWSLETKGNRAVVLDKEGKYDEAELNGRTRTLLHL